MTTIDEINAREGRVWCVWCEHLVKLRKDSRARRHRWEIYEDGWATCRYESCPGSDKTREEMAAAA